MPRAVRLRQWTAPVLVLALAVAGLTLGAPPLSSGAGPAPERTITLRPVLTNVPSTWPQEAFGASLGSFERPTRAMRDAATEAALAGPPGWHPRARSDATDLATGMVFRFATGVLAPCIGNGPVRILQSGRYQLAPGSATPSLAGRQVLFSGQDVLRSRTLRWSAGDVSSKPFVGTAVETTASELGRARIAVMLRTRHQGHDVRWSVDDLSITITFADHCGIRDPREAAAWELNEGDGSPAATWLPATVEEEIVHRGDGRIGPRLWTPDSPQNSLTGDLDVRATLRPGDWQDLATAALTKWIDALDPAGHDTIDAYEIGVWTGRPFLEWTDTATVEHLVQPEIPLRNGPGEVTFRFTLDAATPEGTHVVRYYERAIDGAVVTEDGTRWVQRDEQVFPGTTDIHDSSEPLEIDSPHDTFSGDVRWVQLRSGDDGPIVAEFDPTRDALEASVDRFTSSTSGETWTVEPGALTRTGPRQASVTVAEDHPLPVDLPPDLVGSGRSFTLMVTGSLEGEAGLPLSAGDVPVTGDAAGWGLFLAGEDAGFYAVRPGVQASDPVAIPDRRGRFMMIVRHRAGSHQLEVWWNGTSDGPSAAPALPDLREIGPAALGRFSSPVEIQASMAWNRALTHGEVVALGAEIVA